MNYEQENFFTQYLGGHSSQSAKTGTHPTSLHISNGSAMVMLGIACTTFTGIVAPSDLNSPLAEPRLQTT